MIAEHELDMESIQLKRFTSDSPLIRLFSEYSNLSLLQFGKFVLPDILKTLISNVNVTYNQLITKLCNRILASIKSIPIHFVRTLQVITEVVEKKQGKPCSDHWVSHGLFFIKFLCPLLENPYCLLENISQKEISLSQRRIAQFSQYVSQVIANRKGNDNITSMMREVMRYFSRPLCLSIRQNGMNIQAQNTLHPLMVEIFRENEKTISKYISDADSQAKVSPASSISPQVTYSRIATAFSQSIQCCGIRMNHMQAMVDCNRLFKIYENEFKQRSDHIEQENTEFREYLLLLQQQIEVIKIQIKEENEIRDRLRKELQKIEKEEQVHLK